MQRLLGEGVRKTADLPDPSYAAEWIGVDGLALLTIAVPGARDLGAKAFGAAIESCYSTCRRLLTGRGLLPLRFWNYLPAIGTRFDNGLCGYEIFNAARLASYGDEGMRGPIGADRVCATAVDLRSVDFVLHVLAAEQAATPVDNPRQVPPHRYSRHYGPVPPAFSRAACMPTALRSLPGLPDAIVSGTASIVGEETRHRGDLGSQLREIALNLASLAEALQGRKQTWPVGTALPSEAREALTRYRSVRLYVPRRNDEARVLDWASSMFPQPEAVELVRADLCRPDLLVEFEGTVSFSP